MIEDAEECAGEYLNLTHVREMLEEAGTSIWHICGHTHWDPLEANSDIFVKEMNEINSQIDRLWVSYVADVFGIYADYRKKKDNLQKDWEEQANNSVIGWFYSGNVYWVNSDAPNYYNTGIYNGYVIEAIKEWNEEGIVTFFTDESGKRLEDAEEKAEDIANKLLGVSIEGGEISWEGEECKRDALIFILFGNRGTTVNGEPYTSMYKNETEIPPELFTACIRDINNELLRKQGEKTFERLWQEKIGNVK